MSDPASVSGGQLHGFVERIEQLETERADIAEAIKDVYSQAKGCGYDAATLKRVISIRRKEPHEVEEQEALLDLYLAALGMLPGDQK